MNDGMQKLEEYLQPWEEVSAKWCKGMRRYYKSSDEFTTPKVMAIFSHSKFNHKS